MTTEIQPTLDRINEIVHTTNATDLVVHSLARDTLLLTGSFDHCYYHEFEIHFRGVVYIGLPIYGIDSPVFSIASDPIRHLYSHLELEPDEILFEIHHDPEFHGGHRYYVAAREIELVEGMVYYYVREDLKPGERIADWVGNGG
ncbi:hypothetical protein Poly51_48680 [Rubripirellula tenax]|uniref:Uncharacterized protein n=1 Tax=Rubripirellula tenax TaxID=2528015 RepID=A0A5C6EKE3_9BACT|nr:hypothetical protein [Rubripirellula tenax]TWU48964.1 hypothetical protein Poly51_48680 [Rubripirellula tenax]